MSVVLFRPNLDVRSGAGQLLAMQWHGLRSSGVPAVLACARGALKFWLRTGVRARRYSVAELVRLQAQGALIVDHGLSLPSSQLVFVHNLATEAERHVPGPVADARARREREFFSALELLRNRRR